MVLAERASETVSRMVRVCTTPIVSVSGDARAPSAGTDAFHMTLIPLGASM